MPFTFRRHVFWTAVTKAWPLWYALGGVLVASAIAAAVILTTTATLSDGVRYVGTQLEVLGVAAVAHGLHRIQTSFGLPSFAQGFRAWLDLLASAFRPPRPVSGTGAMLSGAATMSGRARAVLQAGPGASLERRIEILEDNLARTYTELDNRFGETERAFAVLRDALSAERQARDTEIRKLSEQARDRAVGGIRLELVGVIWVGLGCVAANLPLEIANILMLGGI